MFDFTVLLRFVALSVLERTYPHYAEIWPRADVNTNPVATPLGIVLSRPKNVLGLDWLRLLM